MMSHPHVGHGGRDAIIQADNANYFGQVGRRVSVGGLYLSETMYERDAKIPSHRHDGPSFFMPLHGAFLEGCANVVREYQPGDVSFHPPYEPHWLDTQGKAKGFALEVGTQWRDGVGEEVRWDVLPRNLSTTRLSWTLVQLYRELYRTDSARILSVESWGTLLGLQLGDAANRAFRTAPRWLAIVKEMLHDEQSAEGISLSELAAAAGVTPVAVIKAFRRHEGDTPGGYLRMVRLARARQMLAKSGRPISAVALDAGFYDHSHFTRAFRGVAGVTPMEYRRMFQ